MNNDLNNKKSSPFKFLIKNGFLHIFSSNIINKILQFCSGVILIRFFPKVEYGKYSYAGNVLSFFLLVEGLGVCSGLLQYLCESKNETDKLASLKMAIIYGSIFDIILGIIVFLFSILYTLPIEGSIEYLKWMFLFPLCTFGFNVIETYLRGNLRNFQFSFLSVFNTAIVIFFSIMGVIFYGAWGVIIGKYVAYFITLIIAGIMIYKDLTRLKQVTLPEKKIRKEFLKYSIICMLSNSISGILYLLDTFLVGLIIKDSITVANYKIATVIPFALNFIPQSVMTFAYPYFARINNDKVQFKKYLKEMLKYLGIINIFLSLILFILAPYIIQLVFGSEYKDSVIPFRILSIGYFFAGTLRIPAGNLLAAIKKVQISLYESIFSGIINIVLDFIFIYIFGMNGAALSTSCIYIISGAIVTGYMFYYLNKKENY